MANWTDGVPGIEGHHQWNGGLTLGVRPANPRDLSTGYPWYQLNRIGVLQGLGTGDDLKDTRTGRAGVRLRRSLRREKVVVYEGTIKARTLPEMRQASRAMRGAFASLDGGTMRVTSPAARYAGEAWVYTARSSQVDIDDDQSGWGPGASPTPYQRKFVVGVEMDDPRVYNEAENVLTAADGATINVHNSGTADTWPTIAVATTGGTVTLVHAAHGTVRFDGLPSGTLQVKFSNPAADGDPTAIMVSGTVDVMPRLNLNLTDWWDPGRPGLDPGDNAVGVTGGGWDVRWHDADW